MKSLTQMKDLDIGKVAKAVEADARVIYFNLHADEIVLLVAVYAKADKANVLPKDIERKPS